jgi:transcriptional regulator with XRE-family HTH domain
MKGLQRKGHFMGAKIRSQRKSAGLTLEELSMRCVQFDAERAPSVSYLSMIETGKRVPSEEVLELLAEIFQKEPRWFLDENLEVEPVPKTKDSGGVDGIPLEPGFLFAPDMLQRALPELLSQTGVTGRQFAHLLIRTYQERHRNEFPDIERSAEEAGKKQMPLSLDDLLKLYKRYGLELRWFDQAPVTIPGDNPLKNKSLIRAFFEAPNRVFINSKLRENEARLKYELAAFLGHKILHNGDGLKSPHMTGGLLGGTPESLQTTGMDSEDVLYAWRDFECSFFAGALLCPKMPFRRAMLRDGYAIDSADKLGVTPAIMMRRMTAVSPYRHWHYFDAYPPGFLRAVYRGNGIPLPWGNMTQVTDPCPQWAVFRLLNNTRIRKPVSQISIMQDDKQSRLYCCHSLRGHDSAGVVHVMSVGVDLVPALEAQGTDAQALVASLVEACRKESGEAKLPRQAARAIDRVAKVLNISWIGSAVTENATASIICPRSTGCPRSKPCNGSRSRSKKPGMKELRTKIVNDYG